MYLLITTAIYFIAIIIINVSATPGVQTENNTSNPDKSFPYHLSFKSGDDFDMSTNLLNFPPNNSTAMYVTYEADVRENKTTTDVYTGETVRVQKILMDIIRVIIKVETKMDAGLCRQKILEATLEDKINTTGSTYINACIGECCNVTVNFTEGSCQDNEIPFTIWSATKCYGTSCDMANGTRDISESDEEKQLKILDMMNDIIRQDTWYPNRREVNMFEDMDTHFNIPQMKIEKGVTYEKIDFDVEKVRRNLKKITGPNHRSSSSPAMALDLLVTIITISFIHFV